MAPKKIDHGAIIILDVGKNVSTPDSNGKSFFKEARDCAVRLIERKIISQGNNLLGIMLLGSKNTQNRMAEQVEGAFTNIEMFSELATPTWKMIRELPNSPMTKCKGDWLDAVMVAADHFMNQSGVIIDNKKIILMTNFKNPTTNSTKDVQVILDGLKNDNFEVDVIGPDIYDEEAKGDIALAQQFVETTNGATAPFEYTMRYLLFHKVKGGRSVPWNVDLSIGPNIKIPVSAYIKLRDESVVKSWQKAIKDPITNRASTTEVLYTNKFLFNSQNQKLSRYEVPLKGYQYGQTVIPFGELDKSMLYESGDKCLSVYGFTHASNITWQNLTGTGLQYVFGRKGNKNAQLAVRCLVECLHEMNLVGIVRRVYNNNNAPKMYALMPVIDTNNYVCLSMAAICFKEDIKFMSFPATSFKKHKCTDAQVKGFVDLINAMDLTRAYDDTFDDGEALPIGETVSPFAQHMLDCIAFRAMHPDEPLPKPRDDIMNLLNIPSQIEKRSKEPMEKLKSLFELVKVEKKRKRKVRFLSEPSNIIQASQGNEATDDLEMDMINIDLPVRHQREIKRIGTLDPVGDYTALKAGGKPMNDLTQEMTAALGSMIKGNLDGNYTRAFDAMLFFRKECIDSDPSFYNTWLLKFKETLKYCKKDDIIGMISEKNADLILKSENSLSIYETEDSHNETQLYENDTIPNTLELTLKTEDDMFADF